ncbi:MAG: T9SS type A sorting domain-containing protein [Ignavibacteriaceae bacterium]|jgi:uncharacterized delta-60 repeat protein|nr:T9SS type A sorting domain-containing protein [Ignavibacteriaceae bacterium]
MKTVQTTITKKTGFFYLLFFLICFSVNAQNNWVFDQSFGDNGITRINFGENYDDIPNDLLLMPNGKILVAGKSIHNGIYFIALTQLLPNGQLDTANFGDNGKVSLRFVLRDYANAIGLQPDGKILLTGAEAEGNGGSQITPSLYRFNSDGSLDTTFAANGRAVHRFKVDYSGEMYGVKVLPDGNILTAGYRTGSGAFGLMRFNSDGGRDLSFGDEGEAVLPFVGTFHPIGCLFLGDSAVVMATVAFTNGMSQFALAMMDRFGNPVTTFGNNGIVLTGIDGKYNYSGGESLLLTNDGKILFSGTTPDSGPTNFIIGRFLLDGTIDPTFGNNGWAEIHFAPNFDVCYDMKVDSQGRILLVGSVSVGFGMAGLARLNSDGTPDTTFAPEGKFILDLNNDSGTHYLTHCIPLDNGDILAAGFDFASNKGDFMVTRLTQNPTGVEVSNSEVPADFVLHQNYPNPFNPSTKIKFTIPQTDNPLLGAARGGFVTLKVYDILGNKVATLLDEYKPAGSYEVDFMADGLTSGVYFYTLRVGSFVAAKKMLIIK